MKSKTFKLNRSALLASVAGIGSLYGGMALAQDTAAATDTGITEVVVTATRRPEPLQKVPIAVSVMSGDQMRVANLNSLRDISNQIPAFNFRQAASFKDQALFLRGLGTSSTSPGIEPTVSTVIDGVVLGRQGQASLDLLDVDHIEVLRGPQGTLFGKNSSAGVLNIVTKAPTEALHGYADVAYYEGNESRIRAGISGAIVPGKWAANLNLFAGQYDGNVRNVYDGSKVNGYNNYGARTKWVFTPSDTMKVQLTADLVHSYNTSPNGVVTRTSKMAYPTNAVSTFAAFATAISPAEVSDDSREVNINWKTYAKDDNSGLALQIDKTIGDYTLTSITATRTWHNTQLQDQDKLPKAVIGLPQQNDTGHLQYDQISQEVRIASPKGKRFDYVAGVFLFQGKDRENYRRDVTIVTATTSTYNYGIADFGVTNKSYAIFGEGNLNISDKFRALLGARATRDEVSYDFTRVSTSPVAITGVQASFSSTGNTSASAISSRAGLQYDLTNKAMAYFTFAHGYKGPAYNLAFSMLPQDTPALKPETSDAFELGLKSKLFDNRLVLNLAAFEDKVNDYQVSFFDVYNGSQVTRLINAGRVSTRGLEGDFVARPTDQLTISGAFANTDAKVDAFKCPVGAATSCNVNGKPLTFAPKVKGVLRANYRTPINDTFALNFGVDATYRSAVQYSINQFPDTIQPAYTLVNANIGLTSSNGFEINLIGKNLGNKSYATMLQQFGQGVTRFVPRDDQTYYGVNIHKAF